MKSILVTGGAGFLGSHLCKKLLDKKNKVICLDNLYTGRKENIIKFSKNKFFKFCFFDIVKPIKFKIQTNEIYNLACPASPEQYQRNPIETIKTNVQGVINLLELAKKSKSKIFQASTSEIYGDPEIHPQKENYWGRVNPIGIRSCYDEGKRCAETLFFDYFRHYKLNIKVARIFNTYGPNMQYNDGRVVSNFIVRALKNKNLIIYGNGKQTRSFCYVDDLIDVMILFMNSKKNIIGPINIGSNKEYTINELAEIIIKLTGSKSKIIHKTQVEDDPQHRKPDLAKAKNLFNWTAKVGIEDGLKETIQYFKKTL